MNAATKKQITTLVSKGKSYSQIQTVLVALDMAANAKEAEKLLTEAGVVKGQKRGIQEQMYEFLEQKARTQKEFFNWIADNGSDNTWRWRKSHDQVRQLTVRLHVELSGTKFTEVPYEAPADAVSKAES